MSRHSHEFMASARARILASLGCVLLLAHAIGRILEERRFHQMIGVLWVVLVIYLAWCTALAFRRPVFTIGPDSLGFRHLWTHTITRVERANLERVMWERPAKIRFFTRDGKGAHVSLWSLGNEDRDTVRQILRETWGLSDVAV